MQGRVGGRLQRLTPTRTGNAFLWKFYTAFGGDIAPAQEEPGPVHLSHLDCILIPPVYNEFPSHSIHTDCTDEV